MTTKDYEVAADALRAEYDKLCNELEYEVASGIEMAAEALAIHFKRDDPRFNRSIFMRRALGRVPQPPIDYLTEEAKSR
jgi:hypothetical protein